MVTNWNNFEALNHNDKEFYIYIFIWLQIKDIKIKYISV